MKGTKEIQGQARAVFWSLMLVCGALVAWGSGRSGPPEPTGAVAELRALDGIDWAAYGVALANWPGDGSVRQRSEPPSVEERFLANVWSEALPNLGPIDVLLPRTLYAVDRERLSRLVATGSVRELHELLRRNEGALRLGFDLGELRSDALMEQVKGAFGAIELEEGASIRYSVDPATVAPPEEGSMRERWRASVRVVASLDVSRGISGPLPTVETTIPVSLVPTEEFAPGSRVQEWLAAQSPDAWERIADVESAARGGSPGVVILPSVREVWSRVADSNATEALRILAERARVDQETVSFFGVDVPTSAMALAGPLLALVLVLVLRSKLLWVFEHWVPDEVYWEALAPSKPLVPLCLFLGPLAAFAALWWRLWRTFAGDLPTAEPALGAFAFLLHGWSWLGMLLSLAALVLCALTARTIWSAR